MVKYWWQVENQRFDNKWKAELHAKKEKKFARFETDHDLYRDALKNKQFDENHNYELDFIKHIRAKFQHIRLWYSGGFDSHTILNYFLKYNIRLDETATVWSGLDQEKFDSQCDKEYLLSAKGFLEKNKNSIKKITHLHNDLERIKNFYKNKKWIFDCHGGYPHVRLQTANFDWFYDYNKSADCNLLGKEKPFLIKMKDRWYATVLDNNLLEWNGVPNKVYFWLEPDNIKSFVKDARLFRTFIQNKKQVKECDHFSFNFKGDDFVRSSLSINRIPVHNDITGKNSMSKASGRVWCNDKDKNLLYDLIKRNEFDLISDYFASWYDLKKLFPGLVDNSGILLRQTSGKFPWFIDIDSLDYFQSSELDISKVFND